MTGLLFTSERSHYFRKSYLKRGVWLPPNRTQIDLLEFVQRFFKILTLIWVAGRNAIKDNDRVVSHESYQSHNKITSRNKV